MRRGILALVLLLAACGEASGDDAARAPAPPEEGTAGPRLSPANRSALDALVAASPARLDPEHLTHDVAGHDAWGPVPEPPLDAATASALEAEWDAAVAAAEALATPEQAAAAGYQRSSAELPGIGAHYVRWDLVDEPFDPARPSMLLYDESPVRDDRLAGFSYWVRSAGTAPEGFAGDGDRWHMHHGLCFDDGMLRDEEVADPADCDGDWLAGTDLWMSHAWVNPDVANPWGRFAPRNPAVCPPASEPGPDFGRCPDPLPEEPVGDGGLDANEVVCALPTAAAPAAPAPAPVPAAGQEPSG